MRSARSPSTREQLTDLVSNTRATAAALGANTASLDAGAARTSRRRCDNGTDAFVALRPALKRAAQARQRLGPGDQGPRPVRPSSCARCSRRPCRPSASCARCSPSPAPATTCSTRCSDLPALDKPRQDGFAEGDQVAQAERRRSSPSRGPTCPTSSAGCAASARSMATYDANGHYARTLPVFDAYLRPTTQRRAPDAEARRRPRPRRRPEDRPPAPLPGRRGAGAAGRLGAVRRQRRRWPTPTAIRPRAGRRRMTRARMLRCRGRRRRVRRSPALAIGAGDDGGDALPRARGLRQLELRDPGRGREGRGRQGRQDRRLDLTDDKQGRRRPEDRRPGLPALPHRRRAAASRCSR